MAVTSEVQIMNGALIKLGAERITAATDANNRARLVNERYSHVRDALLASHPWRFATAYAALALVSPTPDDVFDYDYVFQLPSDCARVFQTNLTKYDDWEEIENLRIACNVSECSVKYSKRVTDVSKFSDSFIKTLEWALAADIAYALTQSTARAESAEAGYAKALQEARSYNGQSGSVKQVQSSEWVDARR